MSNEAKTSRPRPRPILEFEAKAEAKNNYEKYQIMINNVRFKIIARKINKNSRILHDFCPKNARLHNKTTRSRPGWGKCLRPRPRLRPKLRGQSRDRGQIFEAEAKILASRPLTGL